MKSLFSFNGRIGRLQYVTTIILLYFISFSISGILGTILKQTNNQDFVGIVLIFVFIWNIAALIL